MVSPFVFDLAFHVTDSIRGFGLQCENLACEDLDEHLCGAWYRGLNEFSVCYRCCGRFGSKESTSSINDRFWKLAVPPATPRPEYKLGSSRINFPSHRRLLLPPCVPVHRSFQHRTFTFSGSSSPSSPSPAVSQPSMTLSVLAVTRSRATLSEQP